jgi:DNA-directed RNA polymerase sigma subunit (sigma70/sigma32)
MKAARQCVQCGRKLPTGRNAYCLRCKPTRDGKSRLQRRLARQRTDDRRAEQRIRKRLRRNAFIGAILETLPSTRETAIVRMRCGIGRDNDRTLKEVGEHFGITRERVRQIEIKLVGFSISKLRS